MRLTQQRKREVLASNLLFGSFGVQQILFYYKHLVLHRPDIEQHLTNPWVIIPINILTLGWFYAIRRGKRWAKILLLVLVALVLVGDLTIRRATVLRQLHLDGFYAATIAVSLTTYLVALGLLFYKPRYAPIII